MSFRIGDVLVNERGDWSARAPRSVTRSGAAFGWTQHYEGDGLGEFPHSSCATKVRQIQNFHMDGRGWSDIAYNWMVCPHGVVFEARGLGVKTAANGTTAGNAQARAICGLWGASDAVTDVAKHAVAVLSRWLVSVGDCGGKRNCHKDWKPTACPGVVCEWVHAGAVDPLPPTTTPPTPEADMPSPAIVRDQDGNQLTLVRGTDAALYVMRNGDGFVEIGGTLTSGPGATMYAGEVHVFAVGASTELFHNHADPAHATDPAAWAGWENLGGRLTSAPDCAVTGQRLDIVARGQDGQPWQIAWLGDRWTEWWPLGGST